MWINISKKNSNYLEVREREEYSERKIIEINKMKYLEILILVQMRINRNLFA